MTAEAPTEADGREAARFGKDLQEAVANAVVGADAALRLMAVALLADGHALIEDVPGVGKTLLARAVARAIEPWRDEAARHQLTRRESDRMASAFEHADRKATLAFRM